MIYRYLKSRTEYLIVDSFKRADHLPVKTTMPGNRTTDAWSVSFLVCWFCFNTSSSIISHNRQVSQVAFTLSDGPLHCSMSSFWVSWPQLGQYVLDYYCRSSTAEASKCLMKYSKIC